MNLISEDVMWDIMYDIISSYQEGDSISAAFVKKICDYITNETEGYISADDIYESISSGFDYYNSYIREKSINLPSISEQEYMSTKLMLEAAIDLVMNGD